MDKLDDIDFSTEDFNLEDMDPETLNNLRKTFAELSALRK